MKIFSVVDFPARYAACDNRMFSFSLSLILLIMDIAKIFLQQKVELFVEGLRVARVSFLVLGEE